MSVTASKLEPIYPEPGADLGLLLEQRLSHPALQGVQAAARCSERMGVSAYVIGGPVRDMFLGWPVADIDVVVEGDGIGFAGELAAGEGAKMVPYARFGTALVVLPGGFKIDVTTAREERYVKPGALPTVEPGSLEKDLYRRDFTINAMAIRLGPQGYGRFVDTYEGRRDLKEGRIRVLHDGSFRDDPTRILRAVRFETRYGFQIEEETYQLLTDAVRQDMLQEVSRQRLREEIVAVLKEERGGAAVSRLHEAGVWQNLFGADFQLPQEVEELFQRGDEAIGWYEGLNKDIKLLEVEPWIVRWLLLIGENPHETVERITTEYHLGRIALRCATELMEYTSPVIFCFQTGDQTNNSTLYRVLGGLDPETMICLIARSKTEDAYRLAERFLLDLRPMDMLISGSDLKELGMREGPSMGWVLDQLFDAQLDGVIVSREEALAKARQLIERAGSAL